MKILINGCFDLFHEGHKELIGYCAMFLNNIEENIFYILINSDSSYFRLRNKIPINNEEKRKKDITDYIYSLDLQKNIKINIIIFNSEKELENIIIKTKPTTLIKGSDYTDISKIIGFGICPICIVPRPKENEEWKWSSTKKREKIFQ